MGFARLAESSIRSMKGKKEGEALGALDKIMASSIGGALATWNQPIEGASSRKKYLNRSPLTCPAFAFSRSSRNAIRHEVDRPRTSCAEKDHLEHPVLHLQDERYQGLVPRCYPSYRSGYLANGLHGLLC